MADVVVVPDEDEGTGPEQGAAVAQGAAEAHADRAADAAAQAEAAAAAGGEQLDAVLDAATEAEIASEEAAKIVSDIARELSGDGIEFHKGVSYRHLMVWRSGVAGARLTPPHDIAASWSSRICLRAKAPIG